MKIALASDHGGFALKETLKGFIQKDLGHEVVDHGPSNPAPVDYPDYALKVARSVAEGECEMGIMIDGVGIGSCMLANKVPGVRAAMAYDHFTINNSREHNNANVLTLGGQTLGPGLAKALVEAWLSIPFAGGRHKRRVDKIDALDHERC